MPNACSMRPNCSVQRQTRQTEPWIMCAWQSTRLWRIPPNRHRIPRIHRNICVLWVRILRRRRQRWNCWMTMQLPCSSPVRRRQRRSTICGTSISRWNALSVKCRSRRTGPTIRYRRSMRQPRLSRRLRRRRTFSA